MSLYTKYIVIDTFWFGKQKNNMLNKLRVNAIHEIKHTHLINEIERWLILEGKNNQTFS
jgi:hypothetical protein